MTDRNNHPHPHEPSVEEQMQLVQDMAARMKVKRAAGFDAWKAIHQHLLAAKELCAEQMANGGANAWKFEEVGQEIESAIAIIPANYDAPSDDHA
jgi:hypothetical protein